MFDTDHFNPALALTKIKELNAAAASKLKKHGCQWLAIVSCPCIELWTLLHFRYTCAAFAGTSPCDDLRNQFPKQFQSYQKVDAKAAKELVETKLDTARTNARKLSAHESSSKTDMWKLVEALRDRQKANA